MKFGSLGVAGAVLCLSGNESFFLGGAYGAANGVKEKPAVEKKAKITVEEMMAKYENITAEKMCEVGLDIVFVQDTTGSFMDDMPYTRAQLPQLIKLINTMFPGSRTGLVEFRDKPFFPLGETSDFCYKRHALGALTADPAKTQWAYSILQPSGGGDDPEDHYQALVNSILDPGMGWRPVYGREDAMSNRIRAEIKARKAEEAKQSAAGKAADKIAEKVSTNANAPELLEEGDEAAVRVLVVITDAGPHYNGQMKLYAPNPAHPTWIVPQNLPPNDGKIHDSDLNKACSTLDYMNPNVFQEVMHDNSMIMLSLVNQDAEDPVDVGKIWNWINGPGLLMQPSDWVQPIDELSSDLLPQLLKAIIAMGTIECPLHPTTAPPTTAGPPTTAPPTIATKSGDTSSTTMPLCPESTSAPLCDTTTACATGTPEGVLIKLKERPRHMVLEVWNDDVAPVTDEPTI